ncbi:MAG TPA: DUF4142 domain-containing protein [Planctomycetota bacterium]|nr:DUF4142 domain-containing protein [Planctomycetota bacterium]
MKAKLLTVVCCVVSSAFAADFYPGDDAFINEAALHGKFEFKAGVLAVKQARSDDVRIFGAQEIVDHTKLNDQLNLLARNKGWTLPSRLDTTHMAMLDQFSESNPEDFDREYSAEMARIYAHDYELFANAAKFAADSDLRAWAAQVQPVIEHHLTSVPELSEFKTAIVIERK